MMNEEQYDNKTSCSSIGIAHIDTRISCLTRSLTIRELVSRVGKRMLVAKVAEKDRSVRPVDMHT